MRIVRHPNIVELKAFYYSNGERVRLTICRAPFGAGMLNSFSSRKMRYTSTLSLSSCQRPCTVPRDISTRWKQPCQYWRWSCTFTSSSDRLHIFILKEYATATSNLKTSFSTQTLGFWSFATLEAPKSWSKMSQTYPTFAHVITELQSWYSEQQTTPRK